MQRKAKLIVFVCCGGFFLLLCHDSPQNQKLVQDREQQRKRAGRPAVVGKRAEAALVGNIAQQADARIARHRRDDDTDEVHGHAGEVEARHADRLFRIIRTNSETPHHAVL